VLPPVPAPEQTVTVPRLMEITLGAGEPLNKTWLKHIFVKKTLIIPTKHMEFVSLYLTEITKQKSCLVVKQLTINCPESVKKRFVSKDALHL
jgi:hypothetical protein